LTVFKKVVVNKKMARIKGITIELDGNTKPLQKALADVDKRTRSLQNELRQIDRALKFNPGNLDLIAQKQKVLSQAISETTTRLERLRSAQKQVEAQFRAGKIGEEQYRAFQRELIQTESKLNSLQGSLRKTNGELKNQSSSLGKLKKEFKDSFDQANQSAGNTFDKMQAVGASLLAIGSAITLGLGSAVKTTMDFDEQMSKVRAVTGATGQEINKLRDLARNGVDNKIFGDSSR